MQFVFPIDGDVLFSVADGEEIENKLLTEVTLSASSGKNIQINGVIAAENNGQYSAKITLGSYRNTVTAMDRDSGEQINMVIYWFKDGYRTYRMAIDDCIRPFENIWRNQDTYISIFEDPFFALFRDLHDKYGVPVHMHIYYENEDGTFNLSMFPDKYKEEFQANSNWLKFTFHAYKDKPNSPYKNASYEKIMQDGLLVQNEILRFAGPEVFSHVTSEHFSDSGREATRAFRDLGFAVLDGYFTFNKRGEIVVSYYLNEEQVIHAASRDFWVDHSENFIFVKDDIVIDTVPLSEIDNHMEQISNEKNHCFHYLIVHEQYFYEEYERYEPDYRERVFAAVDWCHRNGYRPATISSFAIDPGWYDDK